MSTIWPFFNHSFSNANINKILNEIEQDNAKRAELQHSDSLVKQSIRQNDNNLHAPSSSSADSTVTGTTTTTEVTPAIAITPATQTAAAVPIALLDANNSNNSTSGTNNNSSDASVTTASLSPHVAYSPTTTQFNITASQLLQSIQNSSPSPSPSPVAKMSQSANQNAALPTAIVKPASIAANNNILGSSISSVKSNRALPVLEKFPENNINVFLFNKLLDQSNLLDEINLSKNQKLINYLSSKDVINTMFEYILFSLKLAKYKDTSEVPLQLLQHDIFVIDEEMYAKSVNNSTDDFLDSNSTHENTIDDFNDHMNNDYSSNDSNNNIGNNNNSNNDNNNETNENKSIDKLQIALQRATIISEIIILPNTNIHQVLLNNFDVFTKLWRGFLNNDPKYYFKDTELVENSSDIEPIPDTDFDDEISITSTDAQKLSELEESNNYMTMRDSHEVIMFNNFLKFIDDLALTNIGGFMNFLRFEQENFKITDQFIKFIPYSQTICDLLVRLISTDKPYNSNGLINILLEQNLIVLLLQLVKKYYLDHQVQDNICNLLNGIVGISSNIGFWEESNGNAGGNQSMEDQQEANPNNPNIGPNDLTRQLVSKECIEEMLDIILSYGNYGLVTIVSVIIEIIRKNNSDYDEFDWISSVDFKNEETKMPNARDPIYLGNLLKLFSINLGKIANLYLTEDYYKFRKVENLNSSIGYIIEPLGYERFKIMELIAELLHCSNMILMNKSKELDILISKRDSMRDAKNTEKLMTDAINGLIINHEEENVEFNPTNSSYIDTGFDLSVGNFFKYQLLVTHTIPLITLKLIKFPWNNFMHNVVFDLIQQIFNGRLANWDEDRAMNQEETIYDDNLSLNKILIWSLFGTYAEYSNSEDANDLTFYKDYECHDEAYPGFFNIALFIVHCYNVSNAMYERTQFRFGFMGHLTLIAEEIHKFQSYVENFGATKKENAFGLHRAEHDDVRPFYLKSSYYIFNDLYETIFEGSRNAQFKP